MRKLLSVIAGAALMTGAACASHHEGEKDQGPDPRIGEKVDRICFGSTINGWKDLKGVDNVVLLEKGVNDWYYTELSGNCRSNTLRSALSIGLDSSPAGGCVTKGDVIIVRDSPGFTNRCFITGIYKWDEDAALDQESPEKTTEGDEAY
ncbi:DUF6491 family protein [Marinicaulis aureus]|uniref:DUF6491 family protein n=1 Tax=Hyphococcus aureus TaxID=2666033 RepID=A0ABW1L3T0_9PROT